MLGTILSSRDMLPDYERMRILMNVPRLVDLWHIIGADEVNLSREQRPAIGRQIQHVWNR